MATSTPLPAVSGHDFFDRLAIGAVDHFGRAKFFGDFKPVVIEINDDEICRRIKLRCQQRRQADRAGTDDRHRVSGFDRAIEHAAFIAGWQNVAQHHHRVLVRVFRNEIETRVGKGNRGRTRLGCRQWCCPESSRPIRNAKASRAGNTRIYRTR